MLSSSSQQRHAAAVTQSLPDAPILSIAMVLSNANEPVERIGALNCIGAPRSGTLEVF